MRSTRAASLLLLAVGLPLTACNAITGADDLVLFGEGSGGPGGDGGGGSGQGAGNTTSTTGNGSGGTTSTPPIVETYVDVQGVTIAWIHLYQGVKRPLMENGGPASSNVPIVAGREGLLRVGVTTSGYDGQPVLARLFLNGSDEPIEQMVTLNGNPQDGQLGSTINFNLTGADIPVGWTYRFEISRLSTEMLPPNPGARFPTDGFADPGAQSAGNTLRIKLVPIAYGADGSNRLPDLSNGQIQAYTNLFYGMYATPDVEITIRDAVQWNQSVSPNGNGWQSLLGYIGDVRANDNAPFDTYYYGIFSPASSVGGFCGGGCVAGLGNIGSVNDAGSRAAIGLGFSGGIATETAVHEIGHTHGRYHAPCGGAQGTDPSFPYSGAKIGVYGYDIVTQKLISPSNTTDLMGYCQPIWVSDYTFTAFFNRIKAVNGAKIIVPEELKNRMYDRAWIDETGELHWLSSIRLELPPAAEPIDLTVTSDDGTSVITGQFYPYDHLPGGMIMWPQAGGPTESMSMTWEGDISTLLAE